MICPMSNNLLVTLGDKDFGDQPVKRAAESAEGYEL